MKAFDIKIELVSYEHTRETTLLHNIKGFIIINEQKYFLHSVEYVNDEYVVVYHIHDTQSVKELTFKTSTMPNGEIIKLWNHL